MTVNIDNEIEADFDFDAGDIIKNAIAGTMNFMKFPYEAEINVVITGNEQIREINREHRGIDRATDVLSFPMIEYDEPGNFDVIDSGAFCESDYFNPDSGEVMLGDIVLSAGKVKEQAAEYGHSQIREMSFLVVHSMLHLFGYDHVNENDKTMEELQKKILEQMGISR